MVLVSVSMSVSGNNWNAQPKTLYSMHAAFRPLNYKQDRAKFPQISVSFWIYKQLYRKTSPTWLKRLDLATQHTPWCL